MKISQKVREQFLKQKLSSSAKWANTAMLKILEYQTADEQEQENTKYANGVGFNGMDANILTSLANFYMSKGFLTPKQQKLVFTKMPKYWKQLVAISDQEKLDMLIVSK